MKCCVYNLPKIGNILAIKKEILEPKKVWEVKQLQNQVIAWFDSIYQTTPSYHINNFYHR